MIIYLIDDEPLSLGTLEDTVHEVAPTAEIHTFKWGKTLLDSITKLKIIPDAAFLDIKLPGIDGIELAKQIKILAPKTWIVFVTGFTQYALEALQLHARGYVMKPVTVEAIRVELNEMVPIPLEQYGMPRIQVQTFGNFEVFCDGRILPFGRSKSKEIFAYLIDRRGTSVTRAEIAAIIWEDGCFDRSRQKQLQTYIYEMKQSLKAVDAEDVVIWKRTGMAIDRTKVSCDYYRLLDGEVSALNAYTGEYMSNYSWAELTTGFLQNPLYK